MNTPLRMTAPHLSPEGEVMILCFEKNFYQYRPVIFIGLPDQFERLTDLVVGAWFNSLRKAQNKGISIYFDTYFKRYGFRHPEDPYRSKTDGPLSVSVICTTDNDSYYQAHTFNPDSKGVDNV